MRCPVSRDSSNSAGRTADRQIRLPRGRPCEPWAATQPAGRWCCSTACRWRTLSSATSLSAPSRLSGCPMPRLRAAEGLARSARARWQEQSNWSVPMPEPSARQAGVCSRTIGAKPKQPPLSRAIWGGASPRFRGAGTVGRGSSPRRPTSGCRLRRVRNTIAGQCSCAVSRRSAIQSNCRRGAWFTRIIARSASLAPTIRWKGRMRACAWSARATGNSTCWDMCRRATSPMSSSARPGSCRYWTSATRPRRDLAASWNFARRAAMPTNCVWALITALRTANCSKPRSAHFPAM